MLIMHKTLIRLIIANLSVIFAGTSFPCTWEIGDNALFIKTN